MLSERMRAVIPHCPEHGDVVPVMRRCPWCDVALEHVPPMPVVHDDLQRALEATTLLHLTEPRAYGGIES